MRHRPRIVRRPDLEPLEERTVPSTVVSVVDLTPTPNVGDAVPIYDLPPLAEEQLPPDDSPRTRLFLNRDGTIVLLPSVPVTLSEEAIRTAELIDLPAIRDGVLTTVEDRDFVRFRLESAGRVIASAQTTSGASDPTLVLFDATGRMIAESWPVSNDDASPVIDENLPAGDYFFAVAPADEEATGRYRLLVEAAGEDEAGVMPIRRSSELASDGNDSIATATILDSIAEIMGSLETAGDRDFYRIRLLDNANFTATVESVVGNANVSMTLYNENGNLLVRSDDRPGENRTAQIQQYLFRDPFPFFVQVPLVFYLEVSASSTGTLPGDYRIETELDPTKIQIGDGESISSVDALSDLDGDGNVDLIGSVGSSPVGVGLLLGNGDGTFRDPLLYPLDNRPNSTLLRDLNGDGRLDLVVTSGGGVSTLFGNDDGTFRNPVTSATISNLFLTQLADLDGDGELDLVGVESIFSFNQSLFALRGNGDGTFQDPVEISSSIVGAFRLFDIDGDGRLDILAREFDVDGGGGIVFVSNEDGTFAEPRVVSSELNLSLFRVIDLNGDGRMDILDNHIQGGVGVLFGLSDGTFSTTVLRSGVGSGIRVKEVVDVNGDGRVDLVGDFANATSFGVLLGRGDGTFGSPIITLNPASDARFAFIGVADLDGDDRLDMVGIQQDRVVFGKGEAILVFRGNGNGTFREPIVFGQQIFSSSVLTQDITGDGRADLVGLVRSTRGVGIGVLTASGDSTVNRPALSSQENDLTALPLVDVNRDGRLDAVGIVTGIFGQSAVGIRLGNGDGTFQDLRVSRVEEGLGALVVADFDGDGRPDVIGAQEPTTANATQTPTPQTVGSGMVVFLGNGDGTLRRSSSFGKGTIFFELRAIDLNRDGRLDLVAAPDNSPNGANGATPDGGVFVYLGRGDGSFADPLVLGERDAESFFSFQEAADLDGDGALDLIGIVAGTEPDGGVEIYFGRGDGTFQDSVIVGQRSFTPTRYTSVQVVDLDGNGRLDLLGTLDFRQEAGIAVIAGNGNRTFSPPVVSEDTGSIEIVRVVDLNRDGIADLAGNVSVTADRRAALRLGTRDLRFGAPVVVGGGVPFVLQQVADLDRDGNLDLIGERFVLIDIDSAGQFITPPERVVAVFGNDDGITFGSVVELAAGASEVREVIEIDRDGNLDLVASPSDANFGVLIGLAGGRQFVNITEKTAVTLLPTPIHGDLDRDGTIDITIVNDSGEILFRRGVPGAADVFDSPVVLNPGNPVADAVLFRIDTGGVLAASNAGGGLSFFTPTANGFVRSTVPATLSASAPRRRVGTPIETDSVADQVFPRLETADLNGDGRLDLVGVERNRNRLTVFFQGVPGGFVTPLQLDLGIGTNDVSFADLDGRHGLDIVAVNRFSGDMSVFYNDVTHQFASSTRYRAGTSVSGLVRSGNRFDPVSTEQPISIAAGDFTGDGLPDALVVERAARQLRVLVGLPGGGFANPSDGMSSPLGDGVSSTTIVGQVEVADFDRDGVLDAVVVGEESGQLLVYRGNGNGTFTLRQIASGGNAPTGLTLAQVNDDNGDRQIDFRDSVDLLVGNGFGDVLTLLGNGDGTFRSFVRSDQRVPFVTGDLNGDGTLDVVLAQQAVDLALSRLRQSGTSSFVPGAFRSDGNAGLIGPGDVELVDLDGQNGADLVFANTGSNNVLVYLRRTDGNFEAEPLSFVTGTSPADVFVSELNGDNLPDLVVANQGSNDVSVLFGSSGQDNNEDGRIDAQDLLRVGQRLSSGGFGTRQVTTTDATGDGVPDVVATNSTSGTVTVLPGVGINGVGTGSFVDTSPRVTTLNQPVSVTRIGAGTADIALTPIGLVSLPELLPGSIGPILLNDPTRPVVNFQVLPGVNGSSRIFTANADGTGSILDFTGTGFSEVQRFDTGITSPSDIEVFTLGSGIDFEVYLSDTITGLVKIIALSLGLPDVPPNLTPPDEIGPGDPGDPGDNPFFVPPDFVRRPNSPLIPLGLPLLSNLGTREVEDETRTTGETEPFADEGLLAPDEFTFDEEGIVVSAGSLALKEVEKITNLQAVSSDLPAARESETLEQYISGLQERFEKWIREQLPPDPSQPAIAMPEIALGEPAINLPDDVSKATDPTAPVAKQWAFAALAEAVPGTESDSPAEEKRTTVPWTTLGLTLTGAVILTSYLGGYLTTLWDRTMSRIRRRPNSLPPTRSGAQ